jgi:hypothetical protein
LKRCIWRRSESDSRAERTVAPPPGVTEQRPLIAVRRLVVGVGSPGRYAGRSRAGFDELCRGNKALGQIEQHRAEVSAIANQIHRSAARCEQEGEWCHVALGRVAAGTGKDEVVATVVSRLSAARSHMVERHDGGGEANTAIRADRTMLSEQPGSRLDICGSAGRMRRQLRDGLGRTTATASSAPGLPRARRRQRGWIMARSGRASTAGRRFPADPIG